MRVVLATGNAGKLAEYRRLLADVPGLSLESMAEHGGPIEVVEDGDTFHANAVKKARAVAAHTGLAAMADDSGLEVDALEGRPGVHSARYAGVDSSDAENNVKLLVALRDTAGVARSARFRCVIVLVDEAGRELVTVDGACEGRISETPRGAHGFGYDPLFIAEGETRTMAELEPAEKNAISHRGRASKKLVAALLAR
ncbi:MAG: RdgB/HAM1 family non-canonical purine NTP pyrophosphatase [Polyangiales bacterium]